PHSISCISCRCHMGRDRCVRLSGLPASLASYLCLLLPSSPRSTSASVFFACAPFLQPASLHLPAAGGTGSESYLPRFATSGLQIVRRIPSCTPRAGGADHSRGGRCLPSSGPLREGDLSSANLQSGA